MKALREFREFATRGNIIDLAIGVVLGTAFGKITTSLVNDVIMPPIGLVLGKVDFSNIFVSLGGGYATLAEAREAGAPVIALGAFLNTIIHFTLVAFAMFLVVKQVNRLKKPAPAAPPAPPARTSPYCCEAVAVAATRCPHCTAELDAPPAVAA